MQARIACGGRANQLVQGNPVHFRQWQQQLQVGPALPGFQPGQRTHRNPGGLRQGREGGVAAQAQRPEPGPHRCKDVIDLVFHPSSLPLRQ